jgi:hypothetical protein
MGCHDNEVLETLDGVRVSTCLGNVHRKRAGVKVFKDRAPENQYFNLTIYHERHRTAASDLPPAYP